MTIVRLGKSIATFGVLSAVAFAGLRGPGKYCGIVVYDRWDGCTLYSGIYVMYISEAVKGGIRDHAGQCVQIDAKKVKQPMNPGDGLISEFDYLGAAPPVQHEVSLDGIVLRAVPAFANGERPTISISVRNSGDKDLKIFPREFAPTLLAKKTDDFAYFNPSDGPSFALITRQDFGEGPAHTPRMSGRMIVDGRSYTWSREAPVLDTFVLTPGEERTVAISFDLPQGEYDFLAGYGGGVHAGACLASNLVAFDVDHDGKATPVDVKRR